MVVHIIDRNDEPNFVKQIRSVRENTVRGGVVDAPLVVIDEDQPSQQHRFRIVAQEIEQGFTVDEETGQIRVADALLNWEKKSTYQLTVAIVDCTGLAGDCKDAWLKQSQNAEVLLQVIDVNEAPSIDDAVIFQKENVAQYSHIGPAVVAKDPDTRVEQRLSYKITGGSGHKVFEIESCSGQLSLAPGKELDYEGIRKYLVNIQVTDAEGLLDTCTNSGWTKILLQIT
eukprot:g10277.t1